MKPVQPACDPEDGMGEGWGSSWGSYLPTLDVLRAGLDVHGHGHDYLQPGLDGTRLPVGHGRGPDQLHLLQPVHLLLALRQAEALPRGAALAVGVCNMQAHRAVLGSGVGGQGRGTLPLLSTTPHLPTQYVSSFQNQNGFCFVVLPFPQDNSNRCPLKGKEFKELQVQERIKIKQNHPKTHATRRRQLLVFS